MTLKETFSKYTLTTGQSSLIDELDKFLSDKTPCFLLKGYAGTGKTFMMKGLTDFLTATKRSFKIAAPTGRAAKVISQKTKHKAYTIHKTIYSSKDIQEFKTKDEDGTETFKFYYELKNNDDPNNTIYIIDEASMLSNVYSEGEFFRFGSGFLLKDLIKHINPDSNDHGKKIIFIGDNAQLPPVNMNFSPALDENYLKENCGLISKEFELTEVVRQEAESGILHNATKIRKSLKENVFNQLDIETNFKDINKTKYEELLPKYLQACNNSIDEETIIIAYSNSSVKEYNDFVRNHFFPNQNLITVSDKVILVGNNYNYPQMELLNGDFGIVKEVAPTNEIRTISLKRKYKKDETIEVSVPLTFRNVTITFTDEDFKKHDIECKIIENLLYSHQRDLSSDELKALYIDFKIRNPRLKAGTKEFKDALRSDKYFNALRIKFGYAVTCHKAQGGEWTNTFLNCKTSMGYFNSSYFRWLYTGITRAKQNLFTIDEPHFSIVSNVQPPKIENIQPKEDILELNTEISETELPFDFSNQTAFVKHIYLTISECLKDENINVSDIRHTNYLEHYTFSQGNEVAVFKINYNSHNKITTIQKPANSTEFTESIHAKLTKLQNKTIIIAEHKADEIEFEFEQEFLREHYELRKKQVAEKNISIVRIDHHNYQEVYTFQRDGFSAVYRFYYNGQCRFTRIDIDGNQTTGLVEEINELL
ncbi:MAG: AAA family ATPase [Flavobacterium lindanitolerans]|uniref:ATP-dependent DNA helicase n=1 Tax=Flavobacterium lindanitolerans TaxID=428988 RepID=UPI001A5DB138|nr:AAA family ATPase [Flavobacterium lindanitolerans]MBL7866721.1 AAA family ATPase [Flavobacterium lindanitolerans]